MTQPSLARLNVMRVAFFLNFAFLGFSFLSSYAKHAGPWESGTTVAYSFWAALALLSGVFGIRHPIKMVPALLMQFTYKVIWLLAFYLPHNAPAAAGLTTIMMLGVVGDLIFIPWGYVFAEFVRAPAERRLDPTAA